MVSSFASRIPDWFVLLALTIAIVGLLGVLVRLGELAIHCGMIIRVLGAEFRIGPAPAPIAAPSQRPASQPAPASPPPPGGGSAPA